MTFEDPLNLLTPAESAEFQLESGLSCESVASSVVSQEPVFTEPCKCELSGSAGPENDLDPDQTLVCGGSYVDVIVQLLSITVGLCS